MERFQKQVQIINLIDNEDGKAITNKVKELIEKDPGAWEEEPLVFEIDEEKINQKVNKASIITPIHKDEIKIEAE